MSTVVDSVLVQVKHYGKPVTLIKRYRQCRYCGLRFNTIETYEDEEHTNHPLPPRPPLGRLLPNGRLLLGGGQDSPPESPPTTPEGTPLVEGSVDDPESPTPTVNGKRVYDLNDLREAYHAGRKADSPPKKKGRRR